MAKVYAVHIRKAIKRIAKANGLVVSSEEKDQWTQDDKAAWQTLCQREPGAVYSDDPDMLRQPEKFRISIESVAQVIASHEAKTEGAARGKDDIATHPLRASSNRASPVSSDERHTKSMMHETATQGNEAFEAASRKAESTVNDVVETGIARVPVDNPKHKQKEKGNSKKGDKQGKGVKASPTLVEKLKNAKGRVAPKTGKSAVIKTRG